MLRANDVDIDITGAFTRRPSRKIAVRCGHMDFAFGIGARLSLDSEPDDRTTATRVGTTRNPWVPATQPKGHNEQV
jgi:hypothetical protein